MKRILIIKLSALGDIAQAEGAIRDLRNHHQSDHLIAMTTPPYQRIMERCPWIDEVFLDTRDSRWRPDRMFQLRKRLHNLQVDMVYDLQLVGRTRFYRRWLLDSKLWRNTEINLPAQESSSDSSCMAERFAIQLESLGIATRYCRKSNLSWMADDMDVFLARHRITRPFIVLIPGASAGHDGKRWPFFQELASWLKEKGKLVVTVPGPDELDLCSTFKDAVMLTDNGRYLDYFELAGVLNRAEFIIGNDTGPTHIGAYLDIPGLALFGNHVPAEMTGIQNSGFTWIEKENLQELSMGEMQDLLLRNSFLDLGNDKPLHDW